MLASVTYKAAPIDVRLAYASWCECKILAGTPQNVSLMIPPKLAVNIPHATATSGFPFAPRRPLFAPMTANAPMLIASPQFRHSSRRRRDVGSRPNRRSTRGHQTNASADATNEMNR